MSAGDVFSKICHLSIPLFRTTRLENRQIYLARRKMTDFGRASPGMKSREGRCKDAVARDIVGGCGGFECGAV
jgi:hypothetical protein